MPYTEKRKVNGKNYFYRVISIRRGEKIGKKRVYLGKNLSQGLLAKKEALADKELKPQKVGKNMNGLENIRRKIGGILKKNKVRRAGIFGSYSRGKQRNNSDIDIAVQVDDETMSLLDFIRLSRLLGTALGKKVDLVEYTAIKPRIKEMALKEEYRII
ncbi:MAG: nucleotidyltransferase family protein [Candidatus Woesearchaeota archaeon]